MVRHAVLRRNRNRKMELDSNRMYTVLNANEAKIGSKCYYADTLKELKERVSNEINERHTARLLK